MMNVGCTNLIDEFMKHCFIDVVWECGGAAAAAETIAAVINDVAVAVVCRSGGRPAIVLNV